MCGQMECEGTAVIFFFSASVSATCSVTPSQAGSVTAELIWRDLKKPKEPRFAPNVVQINLSSHV